MNALETSRSYFETFGRPMLERDFPQVLPYLAAGLFGSGSECFGFDDAVSADHDVEPGFCLFLPGEDVVDRRTAFLLERAYARHNQDRRGFRRRHRRSRLRRPGRHGQRDQKRRDSREKEDRTPRDPERGHQMQESEVHNLDGALPASAFPPDGPVGTRLPVRLVRGARQNRFR